MRVVDLGCGTGELTRTLHERLQARQTWGIDSSEAMLEEARENEVTGIRFVEARIEEFRDEEPFDLVFSNAALHWLPNQADTLRRLTTLLSSSGQIAVQVPANHGHSTYEVAAQIAQESPFREALKGYVRDASVLKPEDYAELLNTLSYRKQHVRLQVYSHPLPSREDVIEWVKGALLTAYERRLSRDLYREFLVRYRSRLLDRLEDKRPYFFLFKRILFWGQR
jgi:trans-aconitate 2-methyltransferase